MDIGEYKRTTIVKPQTIPVPQRETERQPDHRETPVEQPEKV
jgi:hypothetical protein